MKIIIEVNIIRHMTNQYIFKMLQSIPDSPYSLYFK